EAPRLVLLAVLRAGAGRRHHHGHAAGRWTRHEASAEIPQGRRRGHARDRRAGRATPEGGEGQGIASRPASDGSCPGAAHVTKANGALSARPRESGDLSLVLDSRLRGNERSYASDVLHHQAWKWCVGPWPEPILMRFAAASAAVT